MKYRQSTHKPTNPWNKRKGFSRRPLLFPACLKNRHTSSSRSCGPIVLSWTTTFTRGIISKPCKLTKLRIPELPVEVARKYPVLAAGPFAAVPEHFAVHLEEEGGDGDAEGQEDEAHHEHVQHGGHVPGELADVTKLVPETHRRETDHLPVQLVHHRLLFLRGSRV